MTRYEAIEKALRLILTYPKVSEHIGTLLYDDAVMALVLPEDSKVVNAELYGLAVEVADRGMRDDIELLNPYITDTYKLRGTDLQRHNCALRYLLLREASGDPMPYKVVRDGDKVRFES